MREIIHHGGHKLNSAIAQVYYAKKQGIKGVTTETGAGYFDMTAYSSYIEKQMRDYIPTDEELSTSFSELPKV